MSSEKMIKVKCFRYHPGVDDKPRYETYKFPLDGEMNVLNVLEYIYENYDNSLGFYSCCRRGSCMKCSVKVNGKNVMACNLTVKGDIQIDPIKQEKVIRDLIVEKGK